MIHLPPKNIFGVVRVSKAFNNALKTRAIEEKVFLRLRAGPKNVWKPKGLTDLRAIPATPSPFIGNKATGFAYDTVYQRSSEIFLKERVELKVAKADTPTVPSTQNRV